MTKVPSTSANQILSLLQSLTEANADSVLHALSEFIELGTQESIDLLKACFDNLNRHKTEPKNPPLGKVVASIFRNLLVKPNFSTVLRKSLRELKISHETIENFSNTLHLSLPEKMCIGLALSHSENFDIRICGKNFCVARIFELCSADPDNPNYREQILSVISFFQQSEFLSGLLDSFLKILSLVQLKDHIFTEILDIFREKEILSSVLHLFPSLFIIKLAAIASREELVDLEEWLIGNLSKYRVGFFADCLSFLKEIQFDPVDATTRTFLKVLKSHVASPSYCHFSEELEMVGCNLRRKIAGTAEDMEAEGNYYFHHMFFGRLKSDAMVKMLARFKESSVRREKSVFGVMVANLFEEYKLFPNYPKRKLRLVAVLFGSLIKNHLVTHLSLGIALRAVLDALRRGETSKMFAFGTKALEQFVDRVIEWPQYGKHILQISDLANAHSELLAIVETSVAAAEKRKFPIEVPASELLDKISFVITSISAANIDAQAKEFTEILNEQYYPWFAQYMVMNRASKEPNSHDMYLKFLENVDQWDLKKEILRATYDNCKVLLGSKLIKSSSKVRSLLKNLGGWLGKLTIGRNQYLRALDIDPKSLIRKASEEGLLNAVIPFVTKVLEPCQSSIAYRPPNPWTCGILELLAEIHSMPNLEMELKFDIEILFKNLDVDLKEMTLTSLLKEKKEKI